MLRQALKPLGDRVKCAPNVSEDEMGGHRFSHLFDLGPIVLQYGFHVDWDVRGRGHVR